MRWNDTIRPNPGFWEKETEFPSQKRNAHRGTVRWVAGLGVLGALDPQLLQLMRRADAGTRATDRETTTTTTTTTKTTTTTTRSAQKTRACWAEEDEHLEEDSVGSRSGDGPRLLRERLQRAASEAKQRATRVADDEWALRLPSVEELPQFAAAETLLDAALYLPQVRTEALQALLQVCTWQKAPRPWDSRWGF